MSRLVRAVAVVALIAGVIGVAPTGVGAATDFSLGLGPVATGVRAGIASQTVLVFVHTGGPTGPAVPNQRLNFEVTGGPSIGENGQVITNADGLAVFRYPTNAIAPDGGTDQITAWIDLNANMKADVEEPQVVTQLVTLPSENQTPTANNVDVTVPGGVTTSIPLNGNDPDGTFVSFTIATKPEHGSVPDFLLGPFVDYTPSAGFSGSDAFTFRVTDANGASATGNINVRVQSATQVPGGAKCDGHDATIVAKPGEETILGTSGPDVIVGSAAAERIYGLDGDDIICGGGGEDVVRAGNGNDRVLVGPNSVVWGGDGDDYIDISGAGTAFGGNGNDTIKVGRNSGVLGGDGDDHLFYGQGSFVLAGPGQNATAPPSRE